MQLYKLEGYQEKSRPTVPLVSVNKHGIITLNTPLSAQVGNGFKFCQFWFDNETCIVGLKLVREGEDFRLPVKHEGKNKRLIVRALFAFRHFGINLPERCQRYEGTYDEGKRMISFCMLRPLGGKAK